jgi:predicted TIM-barrel fold metal-dependent hydrolase
MIADAHCHFFSESFLDILIKDTPHAERGVAAVCERLGWDPPGDVNALADRWIAELDRHHVASAALIASVPGDENSVAMAVARHPTRFVGYFMFNPVASDADLRLERAMSRKLRTICLFPAMHGYRLDDSRVHALFAAAARQRAAVFCHCGALTVGVRKRLGLQSPFDWRLGDPLALAAVAVRFPSVPVIIPHFGAGLFREALMAADQCPNIHLDTSSSNGWMKYHPGLTLETVFRQALAVAGPERLLFGTDSSFFPRGWQKGIYDAQRAVLDSLGVDSEAQTLVFGGNFERLFDRPNDQIG